MNSGKVVIAGGSGFVGRHLIRHLHRAGYDLKVLSRKANCFEGDPEFHSIEVVEWSHESTQWYSEIDNANGVINLSGRNLAQGRWSQAVRRDILDSRLKTTRAIVRAVTTVEHPPNCIIQASAVGFYGTQTGMNTTETSRNGSGFLGDVTREWETALEPVNDVPNVRTIVLRSGVILGTEGGLYHKISCLVRHFMGGIIGNGKNWMSWIHVDDLARIVERALKNPDMSGVYNSVSPEPVQSGEFMKMLAKTWHRPLVPTPPIAILRLILGDIVEELMLASQHVIPARLTEEEFSFTYPFLDKALQALHSQANHQGIPPSDCKPEFHSV